MKGGAAVHSLRHALGGRRSGWWRGAGMRTFQANKGDGGFEAVRIEKLARVAQLAHALEQ